MHVFFWRFPPAFLTELWLCTNQCKDGGGRGVGRAWGGDLTFFKNLQSNSLSTGKSFQSNATKFPDLGLHIAVIYPKAGSKKGTIKISLNKTFFIERKLISEQMILKSKYVKYWSPDI